MHDTSATRPTAPAGAPAAHGLTLLFVHGWAFDASFWDEVRAHLTLHLPSYPQQVLDAGYFGAPVQPGVLPAPPSGHWPAHAGPVIAIGHSLGAMQLLGRLPPRCAGLVMINGFARFCRSPDHPSGTPPRLLTRMLDKLAETPGEVVNDFRARCGAPACTRSPEPAALATGLRALRDHDERAALAGLTLPVRLLAGQSDPLVPAPMSQALAIPDTHWHPGGHLLPLTDSAWCAERIVEFILSIQPCQPRARKINGIRPIEAPLLTILSTSRKSPDASVPAPPAMTGTPGFKSTPPWNWPAALPRCHCRHAPGFWKSAVAPAC
ncbi:pimeloyl-[acyl-carrier protein] methyl ester esterase [Kerstersia gyiorum]|nr:pimeloyl-[acyl-carrier protein] methyl ester esterase [Kerstersia gyiorum]